MRVTSLRRVRSTNKVPERFANQPNTGQFRTSALETNAEYIVSCDSSCLMQIQGLADKQQKPIKTIHLAEVLANQ